MARVSLFSNCAIAHLRWRAAAEIGDEHERGAGELGARDLGSECTRAAVLAQGAERQRDRKHNDQAVA